MKAVVLTTAILLCAVAPAYADNFASVITMYKKYIAFDADADAAGERALEGAARYVEATGHLGGNDLNDDTCITRLEHLHSVVDGQLFALTHLLLAQKSMSLPHDKTLITEQVKQVAGDTYDGIVAAKLRLTDEGGACPRSAVGTVYSERLVELFQETQMLMSSIR